MTVFEDIGASSDIGEGAMQAVELSSGAAVCVFRLHGTIGAVGNVCTHAEFLMSDGFLNPDGTIECAWHGARFDCRTGAVRRHPATEPLPVYEVRIADGRVLVGEALHASREATP